ncbi:hypothetical protein F511_22855 [Dorcoceras hygrometricum]|uniref:Splicing factor 3B subunit 1-like n=1 Tax=Dorcoceras hygrometricum TaxID=472368 RepID=A0A2Z7ADQ1_9LAMI|nr:hypothetical protein F511_22855 [Dorcoceras hygrometricum]
MTGFLGFPSVLYEQELEQFFDTASVRENEIICSVQGKFVGISEEVFAGAFELSIEGLTDVADVPNDLAGSFDAVTHERFLLMTTIHFGLKINWSKILFDIIKEMVTKYSKQAKGFAAQICVLLKGATNMTLGEAKTFPPLKILTVKTFGTYVSKNKNIANHEDESVEPVAKKAATKRRPAPAVVVQNPEPISVVSAAIPRAQRRRAPKRKLMLQEGSDDEIVDNIVHQVIADTAEIETREPYSEETIVIETAGKDLVEMESEPLRKVLEHTENYTSDEESMSIDDLLMQIPDNMMLPSVIAAEPTRIKFGLGIEIKGVNDGD